MHELAALMHLHARDEPATLDPPKRSEAWAQSAVRLEGAQKGCMLFRNNVGALADDRGRWVRYGLANDSKKLNEEVKSGDLIGWRRVTITPPMVGCVIAQFVSRECKRPGWSYGGDDHERAQLKWAHLVLADGGDAGFATGPGTL
jgi:hypothetical protein